MVTPVNYCKGAQRIIDRYLHNRADEAEKRALTWPLLRHAPGLTDQAPQYRHNWYIYKLGESK